MVWYSHLFQNFPQFILIHTVKVFGIINKAEIDVFLDFSGGSDGKASVYNAGDPGSIPGLGRSAGEGNGNPLHTLAWKIPWTEEPGRLQSMGSQRVEHD